MTFMSGISRPNVMKSIRSLLQTCVHDRCKVPYHMRTHRLCLVMQKYITIFYDFYPLSEASSALKIAKVTLVHPQY